jgi:hypothetical protein
VSRDVDAFDRWWDDVGSGVRPDPLEDFEAFGRRIALLSWTESRVELEAALALLRSRSGSPGDTMP